MYFAAHEVPRLLDLCRGLLSLRHLQRLVIKSSLMTPTNAARVGAGIATLARARQEPRLFLDQSRVTVWTIRPAALGCMGLPAPSYINDGTMVSIYGACSACVCP